MTARKVVVAPDSFKGTLAANRVAAALARGWRSVRPDDEVIELPQADGGEGTADAIARSVRGAERRSAGRVTGPDGSPVDGWWLDLGDGTAVVELAACSGITLMQSLDPLGATSRGTGEVMAAALDAGCERIMVAVGGSASTDGGAPVLAALGARRPPPRGAVVLTDVRTPLLGPEGSARMFAPQKGAGEAKIALLEQRLEALAERLDADPMAPGAGAAGGVAFGLMAWGATLASGAAEVARLTGLEGWAKRAAIVVTGEGRYDPQSRRGKVVGHVLVACENVAVVAGECSEPPPCWHASLTALTGSREEAMAAPERWLEVAGAKAADEATMRWQPA